MIEMKRVLFLTDFSDEAAEALEYARDFADKFQARLYVLHVIDDATHKRYGRKSIATSCVDRPIVRC